MIATVIFCGDYLPDRCGVVHYSHRLRQALGRRGVTSTVLTTRRAAAGQADERVIGVVDDWGAGALPTLAREARRLDPDVVHIQFAPGSYRFKRAIALLPLVLRGAGYGGPIVTTLHEYGGWVWRAGRLDGVRQVIGDRLQHRGWWDEEAFFLTPLSSAIILTNAAPKPLLLSRLPRAASRIREIPIGVNVDRVPCSLPQAKEAVRQRTGWGDGAQVLAFFGFLHPVKGLETLLRALARINRLRPKVCLLLIGGWESLALDGFEALDYIATLENLARRLGVVDRIHLTGHIDDAAASILLSGADLGVLPFNHGASLKSGSLRALLAHGLPTVTTECAPPVPEVRCLARLVPPRNPERLASALVDLLDDRPERARLRAAGRIFAGRSSWDTIAREHLGLYKELLGHNLFGASRVLRETSLPAAKEDRTHAHLAGL